MMKLSEKVSYIARHEPDMGAATAFDRVRAANKTLREVDIFHPDDITHLAWVMAYHATFHPDTPIKDLISGLQNKNSSPAPGERVLLEPDWSLVPSGGVPGNN